ncbi:MAG: ribose 5-phosphate isomerase B [Candidatus Aminicenantia bacterium]
MKIALGSDHAGFELKEKIKDYLTSKKIRFKDFGTFSLESVDYVDYGEKVAKAVSQGEYDRGILICGTGLGMTIVANKFKGIRAALCHNEYTAQMSRAHNDSNILIMGGRVVADETAFRIVEVWLEAPFERNRHLRRIKKISKIEEKNFL